MNTTTLRADVRNRLSDPATGLWSDAQLDTALTRAHGQIAPGFPVEITATVTVATDARSIARPADAVAVIEVLDAEGVTVDRYDGPRDRTDQHRAQSWHPFGTKLALSRTVRADEAGLWTIYHTTIPTKPTVTTAAWELPDTVQGAIVALAAASCLRSRIVDDAKRGHPTAPIVGRLANDLEAEAAAALAVHRRRARVLR